MKTIRRWAPRLLVPLCLVGASFAQAASQPGTVVAWGTCWNGSSYVPASTLVPAGLSGAVAVAGGYGHSLALNTNGTVVAWGNNSSGQTNVPAGLSNVVAVAAGDHHSLALRSNGLVVAWGDDYYGQTNIPAGLSNVVAIAAGGGHNLALRSNGRVAAWGYNNRGQTNVPPSLSDVMAVAAGEFHSLALRSNGMVVAWGDNYNDQTNVPAGLSNARAIAAGADFGLALEPGHPVWAWGSYWNGETYVPMTAPADLNDVVALAGGADHALALQGNGTVRAWGMYFDGTAYVPMQAPSGLTNVVAVAAGYYHSLAIAVQPGPLTLWPPPPSISLAGGASTNITVGVSSESPYGCQWLSNGVPITGATSNTFVLTNFALSKAGVYSVLVTNQGQSAITGTVVRLANSPVILVDGVDVGAGTATRIDAPVQVTMSSAFGADAHIYYTLDGSAPEYFAGTPYAGAFTLTNGALIRAIAYDAAYLDSAEAVPVQVQILPTYPLSVSTPGGGSVSNYPTAYTNANRYVSGTNVTLTATPLANWSFMYWNINGTNNPTNPATLTMDRSYSVQAIFGTSLNLVTNGNGQVFRYPASGTNAYGSTVQLSALPATNNYFFGWAGAASGFNNPLSVQVTGTSGITALFAPLGTNQVSLTVTNSGNGTVSANYFRNVYTNGETVLLTAVPAAGYLFTGWSGDGSGINNPLALHLNASKYVIANFALAANLSPPVITQAPPPAISLARHASTNLSVGVFSPSSYTCQWLSNGAPIAAAIGTNLAIADFDVSQAAAYSVVVSNPFGTATAASVVRLTNSPVILVDGVDVGGGTVTRVDSSVGVSMSSGFGGGTHIYYTLDGSQPVLGGNLYVGPFTLTNSARIRAVAFNSDYTTSAEAAPVQVQISPTYPLSVSTPGGGSVSNYPTAYTNGNRYVSGTSVTLTPNPLTNWSFLYWTINSTNSAANPATVVMDRSNSVQAVFGTALNLFTNGNGQVYPYPASGPYPYGSTVQLSALPATNNYFFGWAGAAGGFSNPLSIRVTNTSGITALFAPLNANQVSLTVTNSGSGSVTSSPFKNVYTNGEAVTLTALPAVSNVFIGWSGDAAGTTNPLPLLLDRSKYVIANFALATDVAPPVITQAPPAAISLALNASTNVSVGVFSRSPYACQWLSNGVPVAAETNTSFTLTNFAFSKAARYSVVVTNPYGSATAASVVRLTNSPVVLVDGVDVGGGTVSRIDASVRVSMSSAFGANAHIYYTLNGSVPHYSTAEPYKGDFTLTNSATIRAIAYDAAYADSAEAAPIRVEIRRTYPLSVSTPGGGSIIVSPAAYTNGNRYLSDTEVTLTATNFSGWVFMHWKVNGTTNTANPATILIGQSTSVQAIFGAPLNLSIDGSGQVFPNPAGGTYPYGSSLQLTALPVSGNYFFGWGGVASGFQNPLSIQVTNPLGITALFVTLGANQVSLTVSNHGLGSVAASPFKSVYTRGEPVTLTAQPAMTNVFRGWTGDAAGTTNPLTLVLDASKFVIANFSPVTNPAIARQPQGRTLGAGQNTFLSVELTGDGPFSYQWRFNGTPLRGATNSILVLTNFAVSNAGVYAVEVASPFGTVISSNASVALFSLEAAQAGGLTFPLLILDGAVGTSYDLEYCQDLVPTNWLFLDRVTLEEAQGYWVDDPMEDHPRRFFRAIPR
jgi:alpha-tubulin suppressor-like RCC1 family protein